MLKGALTTTVLLLAYAQPALTASQKVQPCSWSKSVWISEKDDERTLFYFEKQDGDTGDSDSQGYDVGTSHGTKMERWKGKTMIWSMVGSYGCSNGVSICTVTFPTLGGEDSLRAAKEVMTYFEAVDLRRDGVPNWVVLAALTQEMYMAGGADVKMAAQSFNKTAAAETKPETITVPSIYKYSFCRK